MTQVEETRPTRHEKASAEAIARAAALLRAEGLVAFPTETVYGLGADATCDRAVARIYAAKSRPSFNPLIAHVTDLAAARREGEFSAAATRLAEAFWPGPLTLVVPAAASVSVAHLARAGLDSVALRVPDHPVALALIAAAGRPIVAPSANRSGHVSPTHADHVARDLDGRINMILDGGPTPVGVESTIVACLHGVPRLLRPGGVGRAAIENVLGGALAAPDAETEEAQPLAPGMLASHYAPRAELRLDAQALRSGEAGLDFGGRFGAAAGALILDLSPTRDLTEAAANLFAYLRELDASGAAHIAVAAVPSSGLGEAINDRLARAAAPRGGIL
jgi:L-threonylcarbamoyladenylate synthase